jgi:hypothetical protein
LQWNTANELPPLPDLELCDGATGRTALPDTPPIDRFDP